MKLPMRMLASGILLIASVSSTNADETRDFQVVLDRYRGGVAYIIVPRGNGEQNIGTGFIIDDKATLITAAHVLDDGLMAFARFPDGKSFRCLLVDVDDNHDLAALRLQRDAEEKHAKLPILRLADLKAPRPKQLETLMLISSPKGLASTPHLGRFSTERDSDEVKDKGRRVFGTRFPVFQCDFKAAKGSSGGPALNRNGRVVGVLTDGLLEGLAGLNFCVPAKHVRSLKLKNKPKEFSGAGRVRFSTDLSDSILKNETEKRQDRRLQSKNEFNADLRCSQWEITSPVQLAGLVDDDFKAAQLIPPPAQNAVISKNRLIHLANPYFRFSAVVPGKFSIKERYDNEENRYACELIHPQRGKSLTITAKKIEMPSQEKLTEVLNRLGSRFAQRQLGVKILPLMAPAGGPSEFYLGPLCDPFPRLGRLIPGTVKYWRHYGSAPVFDREIFVMYGINQDVFITVQFEAPLSERMGPFLADDFVERLFVAATVSFPQ